MVSPIHLRITDGLTPEAIEAVRKRSTAPVIVEIPGAWCFRIRRPPPPTGWKPKLRQELKDSLLPQPLTELYWDELIEEDGTWSLFAVPRLRLESRLGPVRDVLWRRGRKVRVVPQGDGPPTGGMAAFPNLAPPEFRARRVPWVQMRRWARRLAPVLTLILVSAGLAMFLAPRWNRLNRDWQTMEVSYLQTWNELERERRFGAAIHGVQHGGSGLDSFWVRDLDALTRLLPEDAHLISIRWQPDETQIDLVTPTPELVREALEASPEFRDVRFIGNLERRGEKCRLLLQFRSDGRP